MKKILCIHGIGGKDAIMNEWSPVWKNAITKSLSIEGTMDVTFEFLYIDDLFEKYKKKNGIKYVLTIAKLIKDWISISVFKERGIFGGDGVIRWYAGMAVQFAQDKELRDELNMRLKNKLDTYKPDLIYCHSLGTLVTYDLLRQEAVKNINRNLVLITAGSQIAHPALLRLFGGNIMPLNVKHWFNFHNPHDYVFAYESIDVSSASYTQVETDINDSNPANNHEALNYIGHQNALLQAWPKIIKLLLKSSSVSGARGLVTQENLIKAKISSKTQKQIKNKSFAKKALLVGINDYPDPDKQLNGCVNDVFRMSEVLQEMGFDPSDIKTVINERATSQNLRIMMDWLLKDAKDGDNLFFFYSGHGAQIPSTEIDGEDSDHLDECLVTYDFDWKRENAYTDKEFLKSYSQLSYGVDFTTILDCCHSGGMTRDVGNKARGVSPPDDIRHRLIKWDSRRKMWIPRELKLAKENLFLSNTLNKELYTGENGGVQRFGRAVSLWSDVDFYSMSKKKYGTMGPYMPLIIEACKEKEYSYEYKHGVTSYGAFTYSLTTILRDLNSKKNKKNFTYKELVALASEQLKELGYAQTPQIIGPSVKVNGNIPLLDL